MSLPSNINVITVTGTYVDLEGNALAGTVSFIASAGPFADPTSPIFLSPVTVTVQLGQQGQFSVVLPCTDNTSLSPTGFAYTVIETIPGVGRQYAVQLPHTLGPTVDLSQLAPIVTLPTVSPYGVLALDNTWTGHNTFTGVFTLDGTTITQSPGGTVNFLRADGSWAAPPGGVQLGGDLGGTGASPQVIGIHFTVPISEGGTGQTSQQAAINALTGAQSVGKYLRSDGTNAALSLIQSADLPVASQVVVGAVEYENTLSNVKPDGVPGLGASGKTVNSDHVHPLPPYVFSVLVQGAKGDGKISNTGATNGTSTVTIGEPVLTVADQGKVVMVKNALNTNTVAGQTTSVGTITTVNSSTSFTATWNTVPTQTATGLQVLWGTDDTAAIQAAIAAANTYAASNGGLGVIFFPPPPGGNFYAVGGALKNTDGVNAVYNSQLTIPVNAETNNGITLVFLGAGDNGQTRYWNSDFPVWNGGVQSFGVFTSAGNQTTSITNGGNPSVIGGPTGKFSYGVLQGANTTPTYTNTCVVFQDFTVLTTHSNSGWTYGVANMFGVARFHARNFSYGTNGVVQFYKYTPNLGDFTNVTLLSGGVAVGLILPSNGNNASNYLDNIVCNGGYTYAIYAMEHTIGNGCTFLYSWSGICPVGTYSDSASGGTVSALHAIYFDQACVESCTYHVNIIGAGASGVGPEVHLVLDTEGTIQMRDAVGATRTNTGVGLAAAVGRILMAGSDGTINISVGTGTGASGGTGIEIVREKVLPGVPSSGVPVLTTGQPATPVLNTLWRPACVYLTGGVNVNAVKTSRLMGGVSSVPMTQIANFGGSAISSPFMVRLAPGQWIEVDCDTAPTAVWVLD